MRIGFDEVAKRMAACNKKPEDFINMRFLDELDKASATDCPKESGRGVLAVLWTVRGTCQLSRS
jgi:hypothetical protein